MSALCVVTADFDAGGTSRLCQGDTRGEAGEDAAAHRILTSFSAAQPRWCGPPPWPLSGRLRLELSCFCQCGGIKCFLVNVRNIKFFCCLFVCMFFSQYLL